MDSSTDARELNVSYIRSCPSAPALLEIDRPDNTVDSLA